MDTYIKFPHRITYNNNDMANNTIKDGWAFFHRVYVDNLTNASIGVAPFLCHLQTTRNMTLYY